MSASRQSPGKKFRELVAIGEPLQVVGTVCAYSALQAKRVGFEAFYVSGAGVANASLGLPDLGISTCADVVIDVQRIASATNSPILVDIDTGWGSAFNIARSVKQIEQAGAAACHIEDQVQAKRCGHRPNKKLVDSKEMSDRIRSAVDARLDDDFVIMARTDAFANEGLDGLLSRCAEYQAAGADMLFPEAIPDIATYHKITEATDLPVLANITEFGKTPLYTKQALHAAGISLALYPLSAFRAMAKAAEVVYKAILTEGTQQNVIDNMQTRNELYEQLNYQSYEDQLNVLQTKEDV